MYTATAHSDTIFVMQMHCDADAEGLMVILKYEKEHGITSYCPTSMSLAKDKLMDIFATATQVEPDPSRARIIGVNMEGPLIDIANVRLP